MWPDGLSSDGGVPTTTLVIAIAIVLITLVVGLRAVIRVMSAMTKPTLDAERDRDEE